MANFVYGGGGVVAFLLLLLSDVTSCGIRMNSLEESVAVQHLSLYLQGVGAVVANCLESQQCLSSSNISNVMYPSMSELQSKAELCKPALN